MAYRFTDTTKWGRENYRLLPPLMKLAIGYVYDNCDHGGVWHPDFGLMSFQIGAEVSRETFIETFGDKIVVLPNGSFWFPGFIEFQYRGKLNPKNHSHAKAIEMMEKYGKLTTSLGPSEDLASPSLGALRAPVIKIKDKVSVFKKGGAGGKQTGAITELAETNGAEMLEEVSHRGQRAWIKSFGIDLVKNELPKAYAFWESNDTRRVKGNVAVFLCNWFKNSVEGTFKNPNRAAEFDWAAFHKKYGRGEGTS